MKRYASVFVAAIAVSTAPAMAASSASASLVNFQVTLYDLNPTDGITPSISWRSFDSASFTYVSGIASDNELFDYQSFGNADNAPFQPVSGSAQTALSQVAASVTGTGTANGTGLLASGSAQGARTLTQLSSFQAYANAPSAAYFTLSPYTLVTFEANAWVHATTTVGSDAWGAESATSRAFMNVSGPGVLGTGGQTSGDQIEISGAQVCDSNWICVGEDRTASSHLSASFVNLMSANQTGIFSATALVFGESHVQAIPEPETYAMLLAGLGLLGALARRKT